MKGLLLMLCGLALISCGNEDSSAEQLADVRDESIDVKAELESIEETRSAFQQAIKEKRYGDLKQYSTSGFIGVSPGSVEWLEYKRIREAPMGQFSYDSIIMRPQETVIVSDSVAYDFGNSSVYYTNIEGESVELQDTYLVILKKDRSEKTWKIHREVASAIVK